VSFVLRRCAVCYRFVAAAAADSNEAHEYATSSDDMHLKPLRA